METGEFVCVLLDDVEISLALGSHKHSVPRHGSCRKSKRCLSLDLVLVVWIRGNLVDPNEICA